MCINYQFQYMYADRQEEIKMGSRARRKQRWCTNTRQPLTPLMEGPDLGMQQERRKKESSSWEAIREWFGVQRCASMATTPNHNQHYDHDSTTASRQDLRLLLGVLACPLAPIPLPLKLNANKDHHQYNATSTVIRDHHHHLLLPPINKHIPIVSII